jgi:hypothetical protein
MSKIVGGNGQAIGQPLFSSSAEQYHELGFQAVWGSRKFRYVKAGAVALVVGNALQARIEDTDHDAIVCRATAIGSTTLLITAGSGGGALDENEYAEGIAVIDTTAGLGYTYSIKSHAAIIASANGALNLVDGETVQVALDTSSRITLAPNPYKGVIQHPVTTATGVCVGGAIYPIAANEFGWVQTGGPGAALIAGTPAAGQPVVPVGAVAGALTVQSAELPAVAHMMVTGVDTKVKPVFWLID